MRAVAIGEYDFVLGFRFSGIDGIIIEDDSKLIDTFKKLLERKDIGIIIIQEKFFVKFRDVLESLLEGKLYPVIVSIPGKEGKISKEDFLSKLIKRAIGIEIKFGEEK